MLSFLKDIFLFVAAVAKLFFWLAVALILVAIPIAYIALLIYDFENTTGATFGLLLLVGVFYVSVQVGKSFFY